MRNLLKPGPHYNWKKACSILCSSTFSTVTLFFLFHYFIEVIHQRRLQSPDANIQLILQTSPRHARLSGFFFAEHLGLSVDHPENLYRFNSEQKAKLLCMHPIIKHVKVKTLKPNAVYVDYDIREPIAFLGDFENTAFDEEGRLFPITPFFYPQRMPSVFLGGLAPECGYQACLSEKQIGIIKDLFSILGRRTIARIDLSRMESPSLGRREIIIILNKNSYNHILRLTPRNYRIELKEYALLCQEYLSDHAKSMIIDLRISQIAYLKPC